MKINTHSLFFKFGRVRKTLLLTLAVFGLAFSWQTQAQTGDTCDDSIEITELPFDDSGNTSDYGNNYDENDVAPEDPESNHLDGTGSNYYLGGDEVVYAFTSNGNGTIDIETVNDEGWNSLYVFTGCPFDLTVAYHTSTSGTVREVIGLPVSMGETYYIVISNWNPDGQDYTIDISGDITVPEECEGTPSAGTPDEFEMSVCLGVEFELNVTGASEGALGQDRIWQSSPEGEDNWTDIDGATSDSYTVSDGIEEPTDYRYKITCTNSDETALSDVITVSLNPGSECYCTPDGAADNSDDITNFNLSNLDNDSESGASTTAPGYSDFTESVDPAELIVGESYEASLYSGTGSLSHGAAIWIDYNDDGVFDSTEQVATISSSISGNSNANFPEFTVEDNPGMHRLRVQYAYNKNGADMDPCEVTTYSETEDYTVNITAGESCDEPTAIVVDNITNSTADVSWTAGDDEAEWEVIYGEAGFDPETDGEVVSVNDTPEATLDNLEEAADYEVYVRAICSEDSASDWTGPEVFTTEMAPCEVPTDIAVSDIDDSSATVTWTPGGDETEWEVNYGITGFDLETEGEVIAVSDGPEVMLSGLEEDVAYDVYVRGVCGDEDKSDWTAHVSFDTELGVESQTFENFTFYPNPVKDQLMLKAGMQIEKVNVYNLLGQKVLSSKPNTVEAQLNTDRLPSGVYLMKVSLDGNTKIFRIIKE